jgi:hypothetical protein
MKRYLAILSGAVGLACAVQACGGDDTGFTPEDSGAPDSTVPDGSSTSDGGKSEGGDAKAKDSGGGADADATAVACTAFDAGRLDEASVAQGLNFVQSTGRCFRCHQSDPDAAITLSGNSASISDAGMVFPPNLTPDLMTGLGCLSNDEIANAILFGLDPKSDGGTLCVMPKYGLPRTALDGATAPALLDASSVTSVVEFLRSLAAVHNQVPESVCPITPPPGDSGTEGGSPDGGEASVSDASDAGSSDAAADAGDAAADASDAGADASDAGADASDAGADASDAGADASDTGADASDAETDASPDGSDAASE